MNSILLVATSLLVCMAYTEANFLNWDIFGLNRLTVCNNLTALDLNWEEVIEPENNWNLFYMNYHESSFTESKPLSTCIQINYTRTNSGSDEDDVIGKFTATKFTISNEGSTKQIRYIYSSIADVKKACNATWTVTIPEKDIVNKVTIPIYNKENQYFCLAKCNNKCDDFIGQENGKIECFSKTKKAATHFKQQYPKLASTGIFMPCSL